MARELSKLEQANVMAKYWLEDSLLETISFALNCGTFKVTLDFDKATRVWFEGTWHIADSCRSKVLEELEHTLKPLYENRYHDESFPKGVDILRLSMLAGVVSVRSIEILADQTLKILFDNETALVIAKSPEALDDKYPDEESPCWRIERFAFESENQPRSFIWANNDGSWDGIWRLSEQYENFKAHFPNALILALPHRYSESSIKVLFKTCAIARKAANDLEIAHLLLGLLTVDDSSPGHFLSTLGIDVERLKDWLQNHLPTGVKAPPNPTPLTNPLHKLSITAWDEARHLDSETVEPDHLLLAVLLSDDLVVRKALDESNLDSLRLAEKLRQHLR
ncbi:MAG: hypothetical protein IPL73_10350 [Candidatus Obscuribacter sp.]|nr:hypothetical protein [Candidatus Obscuribacter sp.]